jgi:hypothetical protein
MALGLSYIPLFPQPLPILLAFMVAAVTYGYPEVGMPIGCGVIGLGLIYQLSAMNFIAMISEDPLVRGGFIIAWLGLFIVPPIVFHRQKSALAINFGILAALSLFFNASYFMAIPIILTAGVLLRRRAALTVLYSVIIFAPLVIMQYLQTIMKVVRTDWWIDPTAVPTIYTPLSGILTSIQKTSMAQFRLYDTNQIVTAITDQLYANAYPSRLTVMDALKQYRDSLPGIMLFVAIVAALVLTVFLVMKTLSGGSMEKILPVITATTGAGLFFLCLSALQVPLAISGKVDGGAAAGAVLATILMTLPSALISYSPKKRATDDMLLAKAKELLERAQSFEKNLNAVKDGIPVDVTSVEGKMVIIKDKLNDVFGKASSRFYDAAESDRKFDELNKVLSVEIEDLFSELDVVLREYNILANCEYSSWMGKFKIAGLQVEPVLKVEFEKEMPIEARIERIKTVLNEGRNLAEKNIPLIEEIYNTIRALYDPNLPEKSRAIGFAREKLAEKKAPWIADDALLVALNNWRRQYNAEIVKSVEDIRESIGYITALNVQGEKLLPSLENGNFSRISSLINSAEKIEFRIKEKDVDAIQIAVIGNVFNSSLDIARGMLTLLNDELMAKEQTINSLLPKPNYLWEKNLTLHERMAWAVEIVSNPQKHDMKQTLENLPKFLSNLEECVTTIMAYSERKELLLNYPTAQTAIETQLGANNKVFARDLPFENKYSEEFLRLFYSHKYPEFSLDEENMVLAKKD